MKNDLDFHVLSALIFLTLSFRTNNFYCVLSYCFKISTKRLILAFQRINRQIEVLAALLRKLSRIMRSKKKISNTA